MNPTYSIDENRGSPAWVIAFMCGLVPSKNEAKRLLESRGLYIANPESGAWDVLTEARELSTDDLFFGTYVFVRAGKRRMGAAVFNQ